MTRRTGSNQPYQSRLSVQDTPTHLNPEGTAQTNEEFRRLAFFANDLANKLDDISGRMTPIETVMAPDNNGLPTYISNVLNYISGLPTQSGWSGYSGLNGKDAVPIKGDSGWSGYSGESISGYSGKDGNASASGDSGWSGWSGQNSVGIQGDSGWSGYSGQSISGYSGQTVSGWSGYSGESVSGWSGLSGLNGEASSSGWSGWSGADGVGISGYSGKEGIDGINGSGVNAEDKGWIWYFTGVQSDIAEYCYLDCHRPDDLSGTLAESLPVERFISNPLGGGLYYPDHDISEIIDGIYYYPLIPYRGNIFNDTYSSVALPEANSEITIHKFITEVAAHDKTFPADWTFYTYASSSLASGEISIRVEIKVMHADLSISAPYLNETIATVTELGIQFYEYSTTISQINMLAGERLIVEYIAVNASASSRQVLLYHNNTDYYSYIKNGNTAGNTWQYQDPNGDIRPDANYTGWITPLDLPVAQINHYAEWATRVIFSHRDENATVELYRRNANGDETLITDFLCQYIDHTTYHYYQYDEAHLLNCVHWDYKDRLVAKITPICYDFCIGGVDRDYFMYSGANNDYGLGNASGYEPSQIRMPIPEAWYSSGTGNGYSGITTVHNSGLNNMTLYGEPHYVDTLEFKDDILPITQAYPVPVYQKFFLESQEELIYPEGYPTYRTVIKSSGYLPRGEVDDIVDEVARHGITSLHNTDLIHEAFPEADVAQHTVTLNWEDTTYAPEIPVIPVNINFYHNIEEEYVSAYLNCNDPEYRVTTWASGQLLVEDISQYIGAPGQSGFSGYSGRPGFSGIAVSGASGYSGRSYIPQVAPSPAANCTHYPFEAADNCLRALFDLLVLKLKNAGILY